MESLYKYFPVPIHSGTRLRLGMSRPLCNESRILEGVAKYEPQNAMIPIEFDSKTCPPAMSPTGARLAYWLKAEVIAGSYPNIQSRWRLYPVFASAMYELPDKAIDIVTVELQAPDGSFSAIDSNTLITSINTNKQGINQPPKPQNAPIDYSSIPLPVKTVITENDMKKRRKDIQELLMNKYKPRLVRSINGGRNDGLGIRDPLDTEFRKEWLNLRKDFYITYEIVITDTDFVPITHLIAHGRILSRNDDSAILNGLGVVYEVDPDIVTGDPVDIETYAPVYIGRRKLKHLLCVYYDLKDSKIIVVANTVTYNEALDSLTPGGDGHVRLAEYALNDVKLSTADRVERPFVGDLEDKQYQETIKDAKLATSTPLTVPSQVIASNNPQTTTTVPPIAQSIGQPSIGSIGQTSTSIGQSTQVPITSTVPGVTSSPSSPPTSPRSYTSPTSGSGQLTESGMRILPGGGLGPSDVQLEMREKRRLAKQHA